MYTAVNGSDGSRNTYAGVLGLTSANTARAGREKEGDA